MVAIHGEEQKATHLISYSLILLEQLNPSPSVNGSLHEHVKFALSTPSLSQSALISHGSLSHGSGTINFYNVIDSMIMIYGVHYINMTRAFPL